ncbi:hypothetical protein ANANG_G00068030 [Anguilla anguilla]|uniref:NHR domain-containing protein n=1 Tax=Anguilla anguilla TaxID=7936 RepID=A0A9D3S5S2_ANGAN|nr:hypothetical protein ANANG_G00068030 [Anguilla anguilla]
MGNTTPKPFIDANLQHRPVANRQYYTLPGSGVERRTSAPPLSLSLESPRFHPHAKGKNIRLDSQLRRATRRNSFCNGVTFSQRPVQLYQKVRLRLSAVHSGWSGRCASASPAWTRRAGRRRNPQVRLPRPGDAPGLLGQGPAREAGTARQRAGLLGRPPRPRLLRRQRGRARPLPLRPERGLPPVGHHRHLRHHAGGHHAGEHLRREPGLNPPERRPSERLPTTEQPRLGQLQQQPAGDQPGRRRQDGHPAADPLLGVPLPVGLPVRLGPRPARPAARPRWRRTCTSTRCAGRTWSSRPTARWPASTSWRAAGRWCSATGRCSPGRACSWRRGTWACRAGALLFGVTSCDPGTLRAGDLPADPEALLDRKEYWVVYRGCPAPSAGDVLSFTLLASGEVHHAVNGVGRGRLLCVDSSQVLWVFFSLHGAVNRLRILGTAQSSPPPASPSGSPRGTPDDSDSDMAFSVNRSSSASESSLVTAPSSPLSPPLSPAFPPPEVPPGSKNGECTCASTRRWTRSSTPAVTCASAATAARS